MGLLSQFKPYSRAEAPQQRSPVETGILDSKFATLGITHRNADGRDLFNGPRTLSVTITDPGAGDYSSGLNKVSYDVYVDGNRVAGDSQTYGVKGASQALNKDTANIDNGTLTYVRKFTIELKGSYQTNNIEVRVNADDHSGNKMETVLYRCGIDSVGPKITVDYDNNSAQNEKYFKADRTATITVVDRNIDNGKIVKTAELKDGAASITVADLAAGDHTISVSYSGDGKYAPITQNTTLTIKEPVKPIPKVTKKATKIVAKKKTFKAKVKVKKYTITLKSGKTLLKKVKVTLKVKGKTYKATTNKKGKATFKIKNLKKKGTYKAVIKFKGNKNYKASSKKVKIKVKK